MKVLLLSTGSVAVKLAKKLETKFENDGHQVQHLYTENAGKVLEATTGIDESFFKAANENYCSFDEECEEYSNSKRVVHIDAVNDNDVCVVCPADFNIIGKMAHGIADDVVSTTLAAWLGSKKPIYICEAMNSMMYANPVHAKNAEDLDRIEGVQFVEPTLKKLACGDYGIGGLAHVDTIASLVEGHHWMQPVGTVDLINTTETHYYSSSPWAVQRMNGPKETVVKKGFNFRDYLPRYDEPGAFGAKRKHDRHEGVDIYCHEGSPVCAVEDGEVVDSYQYTGEASNCGWWNDTWCIKVKGESGVVTYGELKMPDEESDYPKVGAKVKQGDFIGVVGTVLKDGKLRDDIRNHSRSMLHLELRTESCHLDGWKLDGERDKRLLDPTPFLKDKGLLPCNISKEQYEWSKAFKKALPKIDELKKKREQLSQERDSEKTT